MSYGDAPAGQDQRRPPAVDIGASLLAIVGLFGVGRVAYGVLVNLGQEGWSSGARTMFLILNSIVLVFALFVLVLAYHVRRGRMWAWITGLALLPFTIMAAALLTLLTVLGDQSPLVGIGLLVASLAALVTLAAPPSARAYFTRRPAPHGTYAPSPS